MPILVGVNFKESRIFTECSGIRIQHTTLEFIKGQWKIAISLTEFHKQKDKPEKMYRVRLFRAEKEVYLAIKEIGGTGIEIVIPITSPFSLKAEENIYLRFDVRKIEKTNKELEDFEELEDNEDEDIRICHEEL
jgi:protein associated with RNAse G/E